MIQSAFSPLQSRACLAFEFITCNVLQVFYMLFDFYKALSLSYSSLLLFGVRHKCYQGLREFKKCWQFYYNNTKSPKNDVTLIPFADQMNEQLTSRKSYILYFIYSKSTRFLEVLEKIFERAIDWLLSNSFELQFAKSGESTPEAN